MDWRRASMETRLFDILYYVGLPLIISWAFWKFIGKSIVYIGVLSVLAGLFMMIAGGFQYIIYSNPSLFQYGFISFVFGILGYLFGGVLIISDTSNENNSLLDRGMEKFTKFLESGSKNKNL